MNSETVKELLANSYATFDMFCALIMSILLYTTFIDVDRTKKRIHFLNVIVAVILYCFSDMLWEFAFTDVHISRTTFSRYATNILMYTVMVICSYSICRFLLSIWELVARHNFTRSLFVFAPFGVMLIIVLTTPWTHAIFSIDKNGDLIRGAFYPFFMTLLFGYVIVFGILSLILYFRTENDFAKEQYFLVTVYTIPVVIGAFIHYSFRTLPAFAIGFTIATLIIYIFQMRDQVSLDALTGINNRRQGERFFIEQIKRINEEPHSTIECLYLFMMDLNKFKAINDNYGHTEGDKALVSVAEVLKEACSHIRRSCIMSRFGGDEFVIGVVFTPEEAHLLYEKIHFFIKKKNEELNAPYKISISIGFTYYKKEYKDFRTFLSNADALMYEMKEIAHREAELEENRQKS